MNKYIVNAQKLVEVVNHDIPRAERELGPIFKYIDGSLFPGQDLELRVRKVNHVPVVYKPFVDPHTHDVDQFFSITDGLTFEVIMNDEKYEFTGPATVLIPAGVKHTQRPTKGQGYVIIITKKGKY
jgi:hypothetical protein